MQRRLLFALLATLLLVGGARAETDPDYSMVLLTENFPPYNMAINGKNFAQEDNIDGIAVDIVREMFKRAGIKYSLTLRFPWDRIYKLALEKPGYGYSSPPAWPSARTSSSGSVRSARTTGYCWPRATARSPWAAWTRRRNTGSAPTRATPSPSSSARTVSKPTWRYATRKTRRSWSRARSTYGPAAIPPGATWPSRKA